MDIRGIIFDKDGTLFNYAEVWGPVIRQYTDTILMTFSVYEIVGVDDKGNNYPDGFLFNHDKIVSIFFKILGFCIRNHISPFRMYQMLTRFLNSQNRKARTARCWTSWRAWTSPRCSI